MTTVRDLGASTPYPERLFKTRNSLNANPKCARLNAVGLFINVEGGYPVARWGGYMAAVTSPEEANRYNANDPVVIKALKNYRCVIIITTD